MLGLVIYHRTEQQLLAKKHLKDCKWANMQMNNSELYTYFTIVTNSFSLSSTSITSK